MDIIYRMCLVNIILYIFFYISIIYVEKRRVE